MCTCVEHVFAFLKETNFLLPAVKNKTVYSYTVLHQFFACDLMTFVCPYVVLK